MSIGIYLHIPYCTVRCSYCDFYLTAGRGPDLAAYVAALVGEIGAFEAALRGRPVDTIHFGGGTPSLLPPAMIGAVLEALGSAFAIDAGAEIAVEANPEDLDERRCDDLAAAGVNRIAIGVQAFDDRLLRTLRRPHDAARARRALAAARRSPIRSVGADLILGLPEQGISAALAGVRDAVALGVDHLSLYLLEIHPRTRLGREVALGRCRPAADDEAASLYEAAADTLLAAGFEHYEISNFARPGCRSRHNLKYWTDQDYLGFGPSAHSYVGGARWSNAPELAAYLAAGGVALPRLDDPQPRGRRGFEALFAGLRLAEGVDLDDLRRRYPETVPAQLATAISALRDAGLLAGDGARIALTRRGRLVSNEVFERLDVASAVVS